MKLTFLALLLGLAALIVARLSVYTVDAADYAYVTVLGQPVATYDGGDGDTGAGLHAGWPWPVQIVQRLDRRLQQFDLPAQEPLTHDAVGNTIDKRLLVQGYVCWRIADRDAVDRFVRRIGTADRARDVLAPRINSELGAAIGQMRMDDLVSTQTDAMGRTRVDGTLDDLRGRLLSALASDVRVKYGIELVDIRLRRFNHPASVRDSIFERIRSERSKKAKEYLSEGKRLASNIESEADEKVRTMLAKARAEEERLKGQADTEAMRIRNEAHSADPEFYAFLKKIEKLQNILGDNKTVLLLSTHRPIFDLLFQAPRPEAKGPADTKVEPADRVRKERP